MWVRRQSDMIDLLRQVPLFRDLSQRQLAEIAKHVDQIERKAGQLMVRQGERGRELFILLEGRARIECDGRVLSYLEPGDWFGEIALLDGKPRSASVVIMEPAKMLVIDHRSFGPLLDTVPGLARKLLVALSAKVRDLTDRVVD